MPDMRFHNHSNQNVWLGIYAPHDRVYAATILPWGARVQVPAGQYWNYTSELPTRVQVAVWAAGALGNTISLPRSVLSAVDVSFAEDEDGTHIYNGTEQPKLSDKIQHLFVLMLENRSFDNILGWLYEAENNRPARNIPPEKIPWFDGLKTNSYWNNVIAENHHNASGRVFATKVHPSAFDIPNPCPPEICPRFIEQIFGTESPKQSDAPTMTGFIQAYSKIEGGIANPGTIMQCYTPQHLPNISRLARQYSVCDRWFSSAPCQTWANRAFLHAGTSFGRLNNMDEKYNEGEFPDGVPNFITFAGRRTIFDELEDAGIPFGLYSASRSLMSLTAFQFFTFPQKISRPFWHIDQLATDLNPAFARQLPWYTLIEPEYFLESNDQHPPSDVRGADELINFIYETIRQSPVWRKSLLIVIWDEPGGCYDHVSPPSAVMPDDSPQQFEVGEINPFQRYGARVPALVISPHIEAGTVFRSLNVPYDHTSVLSSIRRMLFPYGGESAFFAENPRISGAPTVWRLFEDHQTQEPTYGTPQALACNLLLL